MKLRSPIQRDEKTPAADEAPSDLRLALRNLSGHLAVDRANVTAWYRLAPIHWGYLTQAERERIIVDVRAGLAGLAGRGEFHLRVTPRAFAPWQWARARDQHLKTLGLDSPTPDIQREHSRNDQRHLANIDLGQYETYLGVTICKRSTLDRLRQADDLTRLDTLVDETTRVLARPGLAGEPVTAAERDWLIDRSAGLHLPAPVRVAGLDDMGPGDLFTFTDRIRADPRPARDDGKPRRGFPQVIKIAGGDLERWVAVLSLGRHQDLIIPERHEPWLAYAQQLPFPVEWSIRGIILTPEQARKRLARQIKLFREQVEQFHEETTPDPALDIASRAAVQRRHEMDEGAFEQGCETHWVARCAVAGATETEVLKRVDLLKEHYARYHWQVEHPQAQAALAREFIPGEPQATSAHTRITGLDFLAAALPTMSAKIGDDVGAYLGWTSGTVRHRVMWDPHRALYAGEAPGLVPFIGEPGAGKSTAFGAIAEPAVIAGVPTTIVQMAGSLERLALLPHLKPVTSVFDTRDARPGALSPYIVIPDPDPAHIALWPAVLRQPAGDRPDLIQAIHSDRVVQAEQARAELAFDDLWKLLEPDQQNGAHRQAILKAIGASSKGRDGSLDEVVANMARQESITAQLLADQLREIGRLRAPATYFRPGSLDAYDEAATLVIISVVADLPEPGQDPRTWSSAQRNNVPVYHNAVHLAARRVYELPPLTPKLFIGDELGLSAGWSSGQALFTRLGVDARKIRLRAILGAQDPSWILRLDVASLVDDVFAGRCHPNVAEPALRLLQVEPEERYLRELAGLSPRRPDGTRAGPREFLARLNGKVERMVVDLAHRPDLLAALTPGAPIPDLEEAA